MDASTWLCSAGFSNASHPSGFRPGSSTSTNWLRRPSQLRDREYGSVTTSASTCPVVGW